MSMTRQVGMGWLHRRFVSEFCDLIPISFLLNLKFNLANGGFTHNVDK